MNRKKPIRWHVDHVNNDIYCDCRWNLALIRAEENVRSGKTDLVTHIKPPYFIFPIIDNEGHYRVRFGWIQPTGSGRQFFFRCKTVKALISLLRTIMETDFSEDILPPSMTPAEAYARNKNAVSFVDSTEEMLFSSEMLLAMPPERFEDWAAREKFVPIPARAFFGLSKRNDNSLITCKAKKQAE